MILYHYSNVLFKDFKIDKNLCFTSEDALQEGCGIYLSDEKEAFKNYGKYCYTVECNEIYNFCTLKSIYKILDQFLKKYDTNNLISRSLKNNSGIKEYLDGIITGHYSITNCIKNLWLYLEEEIYSLDLKFDLYEYESYLLEDWDKFLKEKVIRYYDRNFDKNIFIAKNESLLNIKGVIENVRL